MCGSELTNGLTVLLFCDIHINIAATLNLLQHLRVICECIAVWRHHWHCCICSYYHNTGLPPVFFECTSLTWQDFYNDTLFSLPLTILLVDVAENACVVVVNMSTIREEVAWEGLVGAVISKHTKFIPVINIIRNEQKSFNTQYHSQFAVKL